VKIILTAKILIIKTITIQITKTLSVKIILTAKILTIKTTIQITKTLSSKKN